MSIFDEAIETGIESGIVKGFHDATGILIPNAKIFLVNEDYYHLKNNSERGYLSALVDLGYVKKSWFGLKLERTDKEVL